jgi:hypothetical protein
MDDKSGLVMIISIGGLLWDVTLCVSWVYIFHTTRCDILIVTVRRTSAVTSTHSFYKDKVSEGKDVRQEY